MVAGSTVDMSMRIVPAAMPPSAPSGGSTAARSAGGSATMVITRSAPRAASAGVAATRTPGCSAASASARARVRFHTASGWPARATLRAIGAPIVPSPRKATFMSLVEPGGLGGEVALLVGGDRHPHRLAAHLAVFDVVLRGAPAL